MKKEIKENEVFTNNKGVEYVVDKNISFKRFRVAYVFSNKTSSKSSYSTENDVVFIEDKNGTFLGSQIDALSAYYIDNIDGAKRIKPFAKALAAKNHLMSGNYARFNDEMYAILDAIEIKEDTKIQIIEKKLKESQKTLRELMNQEIKFNNVKEADILSYIDEKIHEAQTLIRQYKEL